MAVGLVDPKHEREQRSESSSLDRDLPFSPTETNHPEVRERNTHDLTSSRVSPDQLNGYSVFRNALLHVERTCGIRRCVELWRSHWPFPFELALMKRD